MVRWSDGPTSVTQPDGAGRESTGTVPAAGTPPIGPPGVPPPGAVVGGGLVGRLQATVPSSSATVSAPIRRRDFRGPPSRTFGRGRRGSAGASASGLGPGAL